MMKIRYLMLMTALSGNLLAQDDTRVVDLEAVLVTAGLWQSSLERTAASASVYGEESMQSGAVRHFADLIDAIPNLTATGGTSRPRYFQIRGIGENSQYEGETPDSTVRFVVDDLDFTGLGMVGSTFDVRQVEVLRGPQAGAFGAHAAGGVIRMVTEEPTPYWRGNLVASAGEDRLAEMGVAVGGPLLSGNPNTLMMRLAIQHAQADGYRHNVTLNRKTNARDEWMGRLRLVWNPSENLRVDTTLFHADQDNGFDDFALDNNGRLTYSDQPGRDEQRSGAGSLRLTWNGWDEATVSAITSLGSVDALYSYDDDWTAASYQGFSALDRQRDTLSQEVRIDSDHTRTSQGLMPGRWTVGTYASRIDEDATYTNTDPWRVKSLLTEYESSQFALFGQAGYDLSGTTRLILGLRWEVLDVVGNGVASDSRPGRVTERVSEDFNDSLWGGKVTLEHDLSEDFLTWASLTRGYKGGGINNDARINPAAGDPLRYGNEVLWTWEAGFRASLMQDRLDASLSLFLMDRRDTQVRDSAGFGGSYRFFTDNGDRSMVTGLEAHAGWSLGEGWSVRGSLALLDSEIEDFVLANGNTVKGGRMANTPEWSYSWALLKQTTSGIFGSLGMSGKAAYFESNNHGEQRSSYHIAHAEIGWRSERWSLVFWARNLTDETYEKRVFFFGNEDPDYVPTRYISRADPRQLGVTLRFWF
jgi:iron complex outermembrane recepter protein